MDISGSFQPDPVFWREKGEIALKILIVEDEIHLAQSIRTLLEAEGYEARAVYDGVSGLDYARLGIYDLMILDVMLPGMDGWSICRQLRREGSGLRILMLTAKSQVEDRITGLNAGADYYLPKPFEIRELLACVNALLRRQGESVDRLTFGDLSLDLRGACAEAGGQRLRLSAREFEILRMLLVSGENNLPKEKILTKVWGYNSEAVENNVEVYVGFLRKKLASIGAHVKIAAIRNLGYHLEQTHD